MTKQNDPLVSVLMTAYNREKYIAESIQSVLASTYSNFELIITDDQSTDSTFAIAQSFAEKDERIRLYKNEVNLKDYPNRNMAASYAKGKYLKYLDSDDLIAETGLELMVSYMENGADTGLGLVAYNMKGDAKLPLFLSPQNAYRYFFFKGSVIAAGPSSAIIRRDVFEEAGGFSGKPYVGDTEMWLRLAQKYPVVAMPLDLVHWREHEGQQFKEGAAYYEINTYRIFLDALMKGSPLNDAENKMAIRNFKNRYCRNLLKMMAKGKLKKGLHLFRTFGLGPADLMKSFQRNKYPAGI